MSDTTSKPAAPAKLRRRWLQFSLRTMLAAVALTSLWLGVTSFRANKQKRAVELIKKAGGFVLYDYQVDDETGGLLDPPLVVLLVQIGFGI